MSMIEERQWNTVDLDETRISKKSFPRILYGEYWAGSMIFPPPFSFRYRWKRWKFQDGPVVFARGKITVRCVTRINLFSSRFLSRKHFSSELFFSFFFFFQHDSPGERYYHLSRAASHYPRPTISINRNALSFRSLARQVEQRSALHDISVNH